MNCSLIGKLIKEYRERLGLSQEDLCGDSCAVSTLSRLENGKHLPSRKQLEAFFSYMGTKPPMNLIPMTAMDLKLHNLEVEIDNRIANHRYDYNELLDKYEKNYDKSDVFSKQYYLHAKTILDYENSGLLNQQNYLDELTSILQLTLKDFTPEGELQDRYYRNEELEIINCIALCEWECKREKDAFRHLEFLIHYYKDKTFVSEVNKASLLPVLMFNISNWYGQKKMFQKSLETEKEGIEICNKYGQLCVLPGLIFNLGCSYSSLGNTAEGEKYIRTALSLAKLLKRDYLETALNYANKNFNYNLTLEDV